MLQYCSTDMNFVKLEKNFAHCSKASSAINAVTIWDFAITTAKQNCHENSEETSQTSRFKPRHGKQKAKEKNKHTTAGIRQWSPT
ncbi:hypothetical protein BKA66DRAFT_71701 [Pyrenochaeta sp. MPI-SDFR-AT-0127]|nr:hypothetical protein BKA66DRAFT_71701 [Pyrenochaeta sp. MPI-SDFR-AT-0127]